ncbi:uncharacterized protein LOC101240012 isoform X1 [Hydra vulgaris]|uniref:uncharacterized protein LOC101240012 isoform X1 n=1 Tax=Hydra vulgaris TaxID=6087 RepID=UPI001F5EED3E|nr:uncharacterized protein LOC101240012 [Hydra vulgaris]XP_047122681.1 uncharacterized protein LOC101240012 [Hydra vulgaris]XP_047122682.1 uncharacterized protein LOC101240012 [Hydra vulgaris]XP_047122683.1 uncharacterized protein LOC101240012 [Hydra vulgaris]XP_047122684.1 uncharacterized protein LOC101240012 [Hydra vulgaris]
MSNEISLKRKIQNRDSFHDSGNNDNSDNILKRRRMCDSESNIFNSLNDEGSNDNYLIDLNKAKEYIHLFNTEFTKGFEKLSNRHDTSSLVEKKIEFDKFSNIDCAKYLVANFGVPNSRKSSSFNYFMTNNIRYPLPNSPQAGDGVTTKPIRVRYNSFNDIYIKTYNFSNGDEELLIKKFAEFNEKFSNFVESLMSETNIDEIIIEIPKTFLPKDRLYLENFEFLDLIGLPDQSSQNREHEKSAIRMNRNSIEKEVVDAFFMFPGKRGKCDEEIIKYMWKCGAFSDLSDRRPPKLVVCNKMRSNDWNDNSEFEKMTQAYTDGTILKSIETSLCKMFDYKDEKDYEDDFEPLVIDNKFESIKDMIKRSASACIIETFNQTGYNNEKYNFFVCNLYKIFMDIKAYKESNLHRLSIHYILVLSKELFIKLNSTVNRIRLKETNKSKYFKIKQFFKSDSAKRLIKYIGSEINEEILCFKNSLFDELSIQDFFNANYEEEDKINYRMEWFNLSVEKCQENILLLIEKYVQAIFKDILKDLKNEELDNFMQMRDYLDSKYLKNSFKLTLDKILKQMKNNYKAIKDIDEKLSLFKKKCCHFLESIKNEYNYDAYENENLSQRSSDENSNLLEIQECCKKLNDIEKNVCMFLKSTKDTFESDEEFDATLINPLLHKKTGSHKLPENKDIDGLDVISFTKYCRNKFNLQLLEKLKAQSVKSKITLEYTEPISLENYEIQFNLDRENKKVSVSYHNNYLDEQLKLLKDNLYKDETNQTSNALYPIFISSVQRRNDFEPNLLIKDLGRVLKPNSFFIFLFIEGGTNQNRELFKKNIDFYKNQRDNDFKAICNYGKSFTNKDMNPIVICYLPDKNLGIGRIRKIMMMFAEHLQLLRFYFIDDDIDSFYEYDKRLHGREIKKSPNFTYKSLAFMLKVLNFGCSNRDLCNNKDLHSKEVKDKEEAVSKLNRRNWMKNLDKIKDTINAEDSNTANLVDELYDIIDNKKYNEESKVKDLINTLMNHLGADGVLILNEIKNRLLKDKSKIIGQVALWNNASFKTWSFLEKLMCDVSKMHTHLVSYQRYQVVLYNLDAIKGIHPVTDDVLFQPVFEKHEIVQLAHISSSANLNDAHVQTSFTYGYKCSDKVHVYYQLFNGVSGYMAYYYSFRNMIGIKSKVNSDETSLEASD